MTDQSASDLGKENYSAWWNAQFPCKCGHPPSSHYLAPNDGECRACADCHGHSGAISTFALDLVNAAIQSNGGSDD